MQGAGNDYIYVDQRLHPVESPERAAIAWSDRHTGIGADGLVLIDRSPVEEADFSMRIFNADGSEAMMCGNAARCIGKYLYERKLSTSTHIRLLTLSGVKRLMLDVDGSKVRSVTVDMLEPSLSTPSQFVAANDPGSGVFVSMGNPHYVIFTEDVDQIGTLGPVLEKHQAFPQRCNIELAQVLHDGSIRTRVWERGSGITMACGTGACATAVAAAITQRATRNSRIVMDGGTLDIAWRVSDNHVLLSGPAEFVYDGVITNPIT